jgi:Brp/Blh family beta-carotene 15,15'-monooxygenase
MSRDEPVGRYALAESREIVVQEYRSRENTLREQTFRENAFRRLPLGVMAAATVVGVLAGPAWTATAGPLPWLLSLGFVGLPHGAADLATSRKAWRGWPLLVLWMAYIATMAVVAGFFAAAPSPAIAAFTALSCWHFGESHRDTDCHGVGPRPWAVAALARGCVVLAAPLSAWPAATADATTDLAALAVGRDTAAGLFPPSNVMAAGLALATVAVIATVVETCSITRQPGGWRASRRMLVDLTVITGLGWCTNPLFSVGLSFLAWHSWRQMEPLAESLTGSPARSWRGLGWALLRIHIAALPLLVPTWTAIGVVWWLWSADRSPRDLAIVSIGSYLILTPAHELLGMLLRLPDRGPATTADDHPTVAQRVHTALACLQLSLQHQTGRVSRQPAARKARTPEQETLRT